LDAQEHSQRAALASRLAEEEAAALTEALRQGHWTSAIAAAADGSGPPGGRSSDGSDGVVGDDSDAISAEAVALRELHERRLGALTEELSAEADATAARLRRRVAARAAARQRELATAG
ncbi:unnamed protein product, partial [Phaeothamnion confervicola]